MTTPRARPTIYDTITIGGVRTPGKCLRMSGGDRDIEKDKQGQPGFVGKIVITKGEEIGVITYRFELWEDEHFAQWDVLLQRLNQARKKKPREEALEVVDPRLAGLGYLKWTVKTISPELELEPGKWGRDVTLWEDRKPKPIPRLPASKDVQDAFKKEAAELSATRDQAAKEATAAVTALRQDAKPVIEAVRAGAGI